jgi:ribonuclease HII
MNIDRLHIERGIWAQGRTLVAGVDEAGRGPLAGPVVAAAVIFPLNFASEDIDDSKKLTARKREDLYGLIQANARSIGMSVIERDVIDRVNIYRASILAMQEAVAQLSPSPQVILADGNSFHHHAIAYRNLVKGDERSMTIAAASIVAKVTRDRIMTDLDSLYPAYGFAKHKGYATPQHVQAIARHGFCEIHRKSFHPRGLEADSRNQSPLEPQEVDQNV